MYYLHSFNWPRIKDSLSWFATQIKWLMAIFTYTKPKIGVRLMKHWLSLWKHQLPTKTCTILDENCRKTNRNERKTFITYLLSIIWKMSPNTVMWYLYHIKDIILAWNAFLSVQNTSENHFAKTTWSRLLPTRGLWEGHSRKVYVAWVFSHRVSMCCCREQ